MKLLITFITIFFIWLCHWVFSDESIYWKLGKGKNGIFEKSIFTTCVIFMFIFILFLWMN